MSIEDDRLATLADVRAAFKAMWDHANQAFSKTDRAAFNSWRMNLLKKIERWDEEIDHMPRDGSRTRMANLFRPLASKIRDIPEMKDFDVKF